MILLISAILYSTCRFNKSRIILNGFNIVPVTSGIKNLPNFGHFTTVKIYWVILRRFYQLTYIFSADNEFQF